MEEIKELLMLISRLETDRVFSTKLLMSPNGAKRHRLYYMRLSALLSKIYDLEKDKLTWLKQEFRQLENNTIDIFINEDKEFNRLYAESFLSIIPFPTILNEKNTKTVLI
ncbi:hypothetical protein QNH98_05755 [Myroides sp. mNGS23_01]|nr:hypothetical protein [Myroides sp. mNGS23_01]WHT40128.1 hypothetical protein QNH98_05755 [Myroides sp. mNGS23_01]